MNLLIRKLFFAAILNSSLFILLVFGIQNSTYKSKVNLLIDESVELPISFILGSSFIFGSIMGSLITLDMKNK